MVPPVMSNPNTSLDTLGIGRRATYGRASLSLDGGSPIFRPACHAPWMPVSSRRLIGRRPELERFDAALERCLAGTGSALAIGGEAGVGKTRLAREFMHRAAERGATTLRGRCLELTEASLPYAPFVEALRRLVRQLDAEARDALLTPGRRELSPLLPELAPTGEEPDAASATSQARLFEFLLALLRRLSERAPVVAAIEDLHWSDRSTRDLLAFMMRNVSDERVLAIYTYRS